MQSSYSWMGTRIHLVLDDDFAANFNRAQDAFFEAQRHHKTVFGTPWEPTAPLMIDWTTKEQLAWNKLAELINLLIEMNGGTLNIQESEITSDYLVKVD